MSLLLDALKKATDEKKKQSLVEGSGREGFSLNSQINSVTQIKQDDGQASRDQFLSDSSSSESVRSEELTLEDTLEDENLQSNQAKEKNGSAVVDSPKKVATVSVINVSANHDTLATNEECKSSNNVSDDTAVQESASNDSDETLSLLINKTNKENKLTKIKVYISIALVSVLIIVVGGLYYTTNLQSEIVSLERKHQIAMQKMLSKTNNERTPEKTAIIKTLVSDTKLEDKVDLAKAKLAKIQLESEKKVITDNKKQGDRSTKNNNNRINAKSAESDFLITKTKVLDPVGENLDAGWTAFNEGRYKQAKQYYSNVLKQEQNNRDAMLGIGAIAVVEKDYVQARRIYLSLLDQDPRDAIATAALTNLNSNKNSLKTDNEYLLALLQKNPDAPHLNFAVANNFSKQEKWKAAQEYYFKAWQNDNENADYQYNLAVSLDHLGKTKQAINFYKGAIENSTSKQVGFSISAVNKRVQELEGS